jgi:hypothetical protein
MFQKISRFVTGFSVALSFPVPYRSIITCGAVQRQRGRGGVSRVNFIVALKTRVKR